MFKTTNFHVTSQQSKKVKNVQSVDNFIKNNKKVIGYDTSYPFRISKIKFVNYNLGI